MLPSKTPLLLVFQVIAIALFILGCIGIAWHSGNPLTLALGLLSFQFLPDIDVISSEPDVDISKFHFEEPEDPDHHSGNGKTGFGPH